MTEPLDSETVDSVRAQLTRLLVSPAFEASQRLRRFLKHSVEETLAGRADRIKAYTVATTVFGRSEDFDPQADPIVRIEAGRLRRAIEMYYLTEGRTDPIRISIPTGGYSAQFEPLAPEEPARTPGAPQSRENRKSAVTRPRASILVAEFQTEGDHSAFPSFSNGLARQLVIGLSRFHDLFIYGPEAIADLGAIHLNRELLDAHSIDFVATGSTFLRPGHFVVEATLLDAGTGRAVWGQNFSKDFQPDQIVETRDETANDIARILAQPYGVIFSLSTQKSTGASGNLGTTNAAISRFYQYWLSFDPSLFRPAAEALINLVQQDPHHAEACACLSQIYTDSYRFGLEMPGTPVDPLTRAFELARHSVELEPLSNRGYHALAVAYWFQRNIPASLEAYRTGLSLNPNATELLADYGLRLALVGQTDEAIELLKRSIRNNPAQPGVNRLGLAICYFAQDRFDEALAEAQQVGANGVVYGYLFEAAALARLGSLDEAKVVVRQILALDSDYGTKVFTDLEKRCPDGAMVEKIVAALRIAGMPIQRRSALTVV